MMRIARVIDTLCDRLGRAVAWLALLMVLLMCTVVMLRYVFGLGWIWMQESITWLHAAAFMLAAAWTLQRDEHVRVDILYRGMSHRRQALVRIIGTLVFLVPVCIFLLVQSLDYVHDAWRFREQSRESGGLPYPFTPLLKSVIPLTAALLLLQGLALSVRDLASLRGDSARGH